MNGDGRKNISRRNFLAGLASAGLGTALLGRPAAAERRPSVVLFVVDDLGWMDCTVHGSRYYETPNVDRLAAQSMRFTNAYSAAPLCTATRASIMTGKYPGRLHVTGASGHVPARPGPLLPDRGQPYQEVLSPQCQGYLPLDEYTIAEALRDDGYRTGFVGKWHLGHDEKYWPEHQGFDVNVGGGRWPGPPSYFSPYHIGNLPDGPEGEYIADRLTDEALAFIEDARDEPFFLNFWQYAVHAPYQCKEEYREYFEKKKDPRGAQHNAVMAAMIRSMDESLGRVLDKLEELGLSENTIIFFSSDNGGNMYDRTARDGANLGAWAPEGRTPTNNAPLRGGKGSVYEGGVRVPTIIYWPGIVKPNTISDEVICSVDFYPTLLEMLDVPARAGHVSDGISIMPALLGKRLDREAIYGHFPHATPAVPCRQASWVRMGDWKLIRFYELDEAFPNRLELYNLKDDIGELNSLAEQQPKRAHTLERMLDGHLTETGALVPKRNPDYREDAAREIAGWRPNGHCWIKQDTHAMTVTCTGGDPFILNRGVPRVSGKLAVRFRMRSNSTGIGQFFWITEDARRFGPRQRLDFSPAHDGHWHEYEIAFEAHGPLEALRIDPSTGPGTIEIEWIQAAEQGVPGTAIKEWQFSRK